MYYIPPILSLRATIERHSNPSETDPKTIPEVKVEINKGQFDVIIKISDQAGGSVELEESNYCDPILVIIIESSGMMNR